MRHATSALLICMLLVLVACAKVETPQEPVQPVATGPTIALRPTPLAPGTTTKVGDEVCVDLVGKELTDFSAAQVTLKVDPSILAYKRVAEGDFLSEKGAAQTLLLDTVKQPEPGIIKDVAVVRLAKGGVTGSGTVASVCFTALKSGTSAVSFDSILLGNSEAKSMTVKSQNTQITVG